MINISKKELINRIKLGEDNHTEFKRKFSTYDKIAKELISFANTSGGIIIFGVDDDGTIIGVQSEKETSSLLLETASKFCEPSILLDIKVYEIENKDIVVGFIPESDKKPHRIQDYQKIINYSTAKVYLRMNAKSVQANTEMIKYLNSAYNDDKEINFVLGDKEKRLFDYLNHNEKVTSKDFSKLVNISVRRAQRILIKLVKLKVLNIFQEDSGQLYFIKR